MFDMLHKGLLLYIPRGTETPGRQPTGFFRSTQTVGPIIANGAVKIIALIIRILSVKIKSGKAIVIFAHAEVREISFYILLKDLKIRRRHTAIVVLIPITHIGKILAVGKF